jgi:selenocysteine-specific translation elongation factor
MADYAVLLVESLTPKIGELIVALDSLRIENGMIVSSAQLPIKGTVLEKYSVVPDTTAAKERLLAAQVATGGESTVALVDKTTAVPSVGHVAHTILKSGKIKKNEKLFVLPEKKEIEIRSITIGGNEVEEASAGARCEIAYRGDLFERGKSPYLYEYAVLRRNSNR